MNQALTVACVKARPAYGHEYVNRLYRAVKRYLSVPHRFVCLTDDATGIACTCRPVPAGLLGWWSKLALFNDKTLDGRVIYFDLDTLITGPLDFLANYDGDFALLRDFYRPDGYGSGVMIWNGSHRRIWDDWRNAGKPHSPLGDQGWMEEWLGPNADRIQDLWPGKVQSFKADELYEGPKDAHVVCFHGFPKPHDFPPAHWIARAWEHP